MTKKKPYIDTDWADSEAKFYATLLGLKRQGHHRVLEPWGNVRSFIAKPKSPGEEELYNPTAWVVSPGHCGSSMLHSSLGQGGFEVATDSVLRKVKVGVLKSHSTLLKWQGRSCIRYAERGGFMWEIEPGDKVIYLYAHPLNMVLAFHKKITLSPITWYQGHHHYVELGCNTNESFMENYLTKDVLNLEKHLDAWWTQKDVDVLCIKYESLYDCQEVIKSFVEGPTATNPKINYRFELAPYKARKTNWEESIHKEQLLETYAKVIEKYEQRPDYEIFLAQNDTRVLKP